MTNGIPEISLDTMYLYSEGNVYSLSDASVQILQSLPAAHWKASGKLLHLIPKPLRDLGYKVIAKNRHRLFPLTQCQLPPEKIKRRFLNLTGNTK